MTSKELEDSIAKLVKQFEAEQDYEPIGIHINCPDEKCGYYYWRKWNGKEFEKFAQLDHMAGEKDGPL